MNATAIATAVIDGHTLTLTGRPDLRPEIVAEVRQVFATAVEARDEPGMLTNPRKWRTDFLPAGAEPVDGWKLRTWNSRVPEAGTEGHEHPYHSGLTFVSPTAPEIADRAVRMYALVAGVAEPYQP